MDQTKNIASSLGKKLLLGILFASTIITTLLTAFSFYVDYKTEMSGFDTLVSDIEQKVVPTISQALWEFSNDIFEVELDGVTRNDTILHAVLIDQSEELIYKSKNVGFKKPTDMEKYFFEETRTFRFKIYSPEIKDQLIGYIELKASILPIYKKLFTRAMTFFITQGIKTFFVSLVILLLFQRLVIRHIVDISRYLDRLDPEHSGTWKPFRLNRNVKLKDEIDGLVGAINEMGYRVEKDSHEKRQDFNALTHRLRVQGEKAESTSRLVSLGEMMGSIVHEIRNPLTIIHSTVQLLERHYKKKNYKDQKLLDHISRLHVTSERMNAIVKSLLSYSRDGGSDPVLRFRVEELLSVVDSMIKDPIAVNRVNYSIDLKPLKSGDEDFFMVGQIVPLSQVLINVIVNAVDAIEELEDKWIKLTVIEHEEEILFKIVDSGLGIPGAVAVKMFDSFFTTKPVGKGTGLGLGLCKKIIERHRGEIGIDPTEEHTCIQFTVSKNLEVFNDDIKKAS